VTGLCIKIASRGLIESGLLAVVLLLGSPAPSCFLEHKKPTSD